MSMPIYGEDGPEFICPADTSKPVHIILEIDGKEFASHMMSDAALAYWFRLRKPPPELPEQETDE